MNEHQTLAPDREDRLGQVLAEWLEAAEQGRPPDENEYLRRYPEFSAELAECFADWKRFPRPHGKAERAWALPEPLLPENGILGDFRIGREIGRGGMGIVYEAEQISLGRRVALKVLPLAATMDARQLQRFQNEARAAAQLHHTNIVPVYFVGCERSVHFYAMQYIDGHSLAELIAGLRADTGQPVPPSAAPTVDAADGEMLTEFSISTTNGARAATSTLGPISDARYFRHVAELGVQAAEALDYAHQGGIVHRDIKPANLLVDDQRRLWITDFGLAQVQGDVRMTATGELVGTLRYMSPEQALAKRVVVDNRTDVYSLGATLYELLTLEPAFAGTDRQELLRQIAFEEPRAPRRINKAIPVELETIVLKALEKNPADRYGTAQELADDLRHWLEDRPIRARRPSLVQRSRKWARRHKPLVRVVVAMLVVAAVLAGGTGRWWAQQRAARYAAATADLERAEEARSRQEWAQARLALERARARLAPSDPPDLHMRVAEVRADLEMADELQKARMLGLQMKEGNWDLQASAIGYAAAFRHYAIDVEILTAEEASQGIQVSAIRNVLMGALENWMAIDPKKRSRIAAVIKLANASPWYQQMLEAELRLDRAALKELAASDEALALSPEAVYGLAWMVDACKEQAAAINLLQRAQQRHPDDFWINDLLGRLLYQSAKTNPAQREEAVRFYTAAVALRPTSPSAHLNLGATLAGTGRLDEAIAEFQEAIRLKKDYAQAYSNLGRAFRDKGEIDQAIAACREAIGLKTEPFFGFESRLTLGVALRQKGQLDESIAVCREAIQIKVDSAAAHENLGGALLDKGLLDDAITEYHEVIRIKKDSPEAHCGLGVALHGKGLLDEAIAEFRQSLEIKKDYAVAHSNLGKALMDKRQLDEGIAEFQEAIRLDPDFAGAHLNLGHALGQKGLLAEAIVEFKEAVRLNKNDPKAHYNLGMALRQRGRLDEAISEYRRTIDLDPRLAVAHGRLGELLLEQGRFAEARTATRRSLELLPERDPLRQVASQQLEKCQRLAGLDEKLTMALSGQAKPTVAGEHIELAQMCQEYKSLYHAAFGFYSDAFAEQTKLADDLQHQHRYNAACAAALAGCGQGKDADHADEKERVRLRRQALDWLRADLKAYGLAMEKGADKAGPEVAQRMQHWLGDADFAGVRGPESLGKLPEAERQEWQKLWQEVEALRQRSSESAKKTAN
jgi:serine/threonine protein kinase/tetratricopeptide (TPR) repeat protein